MIVKQVVVIEIIYDSASVNYTYYHHYEPDG